jgi:alginate export protein
LRTILVVVFVLVSVHAAAQDSQTRVYRSNTADEDWTFLKTAPKTDFWDPIKYIPLGRDDRSLTLSGEFRVRPEGFRIRETATRPSTVDNYALQRYLFGADLRLGQRFRVFGELQSGIINGSLRSPRPSDQNSVDLHQMFFELRQPVRQKNRFGVIVGRQEIEIGSTRLISASPGLNVKRSFDGLAISYRTPSWSVVGVGAELVALNAGAFDDRPDHEQRFWGGAASRNGKTLQRELGVYYLGIDREHSLYAQALGPELRHTLGGKWNGAGPRLDLNYDVVFQWGRFADAPIRAWAFATETGYRLQSTAWRPRVSVRTDMASGDKDSTDPELQSFNPLFPGNSYSGAVGLFGPTNLVDFNLAVTFFPRRDLIVGVEAPSYWRTSTGDGIYSTDLRLLIRPDAGSGKYVGTNPGVTAVWQATRHLQLQGAITRFFSGTFLENTFVNNGFGFYSFTTRYRF